MQMRPGVQFYTSAHLIVGQVNPGRRRLSDHLNDPNTNYVEVDESHWYDLLAEGGPSVSVGHTVMRKELIHIVVPQEAPDPRAPARVQVQQTELTLAFPLITVSGAVFHRPGDPTNLMQLFAQQARQFMPVGGAFLRFLPNGQFDAAFPTVMVNVRHINFWWTA